ncbi:hypothetical protein FCM35_KLT20030 [Carex littledalei]|uniref:Transcription termination factor MTEF18, mitochondrial n=1 Tax=Carex littledalei TaxID=544730 RepID=A0A833R9L2_9POAL|nr:hypothetical protein FCM35_KLT20030 [Carex littledalei]
MALFSIFCKRFRNVPFSALRPSFYSTSASIAPKPPKIKALTYYAVEAAMTALKDHLYSTRSLPFSLAEQISLNSPISLSSYLSRIQFPASSLNSSDFPQFFRRSFYFKEPINEFDFLFESIGVFDKPKPSKSLFLSDDLRLVEGVNQLIHLGFPCKKIGLLYPSKALWVAPNELLRRFEKVWNYGFSERNCVVAICLAFPKVLTGDDADSLLGDLRAFFVANDVVNSMENKLDIYFEICEKIQIFYELGSAEGSIGSLLRKNDWVIFDTDKKELRKRLGFFAKLGMKEDLGQFVLRNSRKIFKLDFELIISIPEYLHCVGLDKNEANNVILAYPYVVGKNKFGNLPSIMCAVGLSGWFLSRVQHSNIKKISPKFVSDALNYDSLIEEEFVKGLEQAKLYRRGTLVNEVEFLQSIGFGMNKFTAQLAGELSSTKEDLHERFELLLNWGIEPKRISLLWMHHHPGISQKATDFFASSENLFNTSVRIKQADQSAGGNVADVAGKVNSMVKNRQQKKTYNIERWQKGVASNDGEFVLVLEVRENLHCRRYSKFPYQFCIQSSASSHILSTSSCGGTRCPAKILAFRCFQMSKEHIATVRLPLVSTAPLFL